MGRVKYVSGGPLRFAHFVNLTLWKSARVSGHAFLLGAVTGLCANAASMPLTHEAYVWQRQWDDPLRSALADSRSLLQGLRVLALQFDTRTQWHDAAVDLRALAADQRPVMLVLRVDGAAMLLDADAVYARLGAKIATWREAGVHLRGVEIDHDCASAGLAAYALWLQDLRRLVPRDLLLSVTALPAWLDAPALDDVLAVVDSSVLEVHAVQSPQSGLFDARLARQWIRRWSAHNASRPFFLALPTYGLRLRLNARGALAGVQAEQTNLDDRGGVEVGVDPVPIEALLRELESDPPAMLRGVLWFRLPRPTDQRAWSLRTLRAVITHQALRAEVRVALIPRANGAVDVQLGNAGTLDTAVPAVVEIAAHCGIGDGVNGYRYVSGPSLARFELARPTTLRSGQNLIVGWARCAAAENAQVEIR